jgi:hypothetical protein
MPTHLLLTTAVEPRKARARVAHFFEKNFLVHYDLIVIPSDRIISAEHPDFWPRLEEGIAENRRVIAKFLAELQAGGVQQLTDLAEIKQGYESKLLHLVTHLLDGFFGIDSCFYNLEEDAHGISASLARTIRGNPGGFWLVEVECDSDPGQQADQLEQIRKFEVAPPER